MKRALAKALWIVTASQLAFAGCNAKQAAIPRDEVRAIDTGGALDPGGITAGNHDDGKGAADSTTSLSPTEKTKLEAAPEGKSIAAPPASLAIGTTTGGRASMGASGGAIAAAPPMRPMPRDVDRKDSSGEAYQDYGQNPMTDVAKDNLSTFAVDVDTASYSIARRKIHEDALPPEAAVRVEEWLNYFKYDLAGPSDASMPFAVHMDAAPSPFHAGRHLVRVALASKTPTLAERKKANLVFLVDVSGSMHSPDKLELAKRSLRILVDNLRDGDSVALVTYAGSTRVVLEPTGLAHKAEIHAAIEDLTAGGSTAMSSGMELAYQLAARNVSADSVSRVIVLSDGDANVGNTTQDEILATIAAQVKKGVTLSTVGFGMGNYKDTLMEQLANKGNGNNVYIDGLSQAKRVFADELGATLEVVAKDVKIQVEWNAAAVKSYRLVGYENRDIRDVDFRDDRVDAGEIGAGHAVTALYEIELTGDGTDAAADSLATVRVRHKAPTGSTATEHSVRFDRAQLAARFDAASADFRWATAVAATAEILRGSKEAAGWQLGDVRAIARAAAGSAAERAEFLDLLDRIIALKSGGAAIAQ